MKTVLAVTVALLGVGCILPPPAIRGGAFADARPEALLPEHTHVLLDATAAPELLGRVFDHPYVAGVPLPSQTRQNPCAGHLAEMPDTTTPVSSEGWVAPEHRYYRLLVSRTVEKRATRAYVECCRHESCGEGFLQSLSFGAGEVAAAQRTKAGGSADVALEGEVDGHVTELTLGRRIPVRGYVACSIGGVETVPEPVALPEPPRGISPLPFEIRTFKTPPDSFAYCTQNACVTENEFIRRYEKLTGSRELHDLLRDRASEERVIGGTVGVLGALFSAGSALLLATAGQQEKVKDQNSYRISGGMLLGAGVVALATALPFLLSDRDGSPIKNLLTQAQARRFVDRYNRALGATP